MLPPRAGSGSVPCDAVLPDLAACVLPTARVTLPTAKMCSKASSALKTSASAVLFVWNRHQQVCVSKNPRTATVTWENTLLLSQLSQAGELDCAVPADEQFCSSEPSLPEGAPQLPQCMAKPGRLPRRSGLAAEHVHGFASGWFPLSPAK